MGKVDWLAAGWPTERAEPLRDNDRRVLDALRDDVPTCGLTDPAGPAIQAAQQKGWNVCVVVNDQRIVAGRLRPQNVQPDDERTAEDAMDPGPPTIRAHENLAATRERMKSRHVAVLLVTTPEGELLGALTA